MCGKACGVLKRAIGGAHNCCSSELADSNVVRVAVSALRSKSDYHLRPDPAQMSGDFCRYLPNRGLVKLPIYVIEQRDRAYTQHASSSHKLALAYHSQCVKPRVLLLIPEPAALPA